MAQKRATYLGFAKALNDSVTPKKVLKKYLYNKLHPKLHSKLKMV